MNIAIVDDEQYFIDHLTKMIHAWNTGGKHEIIIHPYRSGEEILESYGADQPYYDVVFMDIRMNSIDGLETSRKLRAMGYDHDIIFTTNHDDFKYVQQSFGVRATNYFKKPVSAEDVKHCMETLLESKVFSFAFDGSNINIPYREILYFESHRNYIYIQTRSGAGDRHRFRSSINDLCSILPKSFLRCQRSYVVNMLYVSHIEDNFLYIKGVPNPITIGEAYLTSILEYLTKIREVLYAAFFS